MSYFTRYFTSYFRPVETATQPGAVGGSVRRPKLISIAETLPPAAPLRMGVITAQLDNWTASLTGTASPAGDGDVRTYLFTYAQAA